MPKTRKPHDHGDRWDEADVAELKRLYYDEGVSSAECATLLGRTVYAVRSKLYRLQFVGFPLDSKY